MRYLAGCVLGALVLGATGTAGCQSESSPSPQGAFKSPVVILPSDLDWSKITEVSITKVHLHEDGTHDVYTKWFPVKEAMALRAARLNRIAAPVATGRFTVEGVNEDPCNEENPVTLETHSSPNYTICFVAGSTYSPGQGPSAVANLADYDYTVTIGGNNYNFPWANDVGAFDGAENSEGGSPGCLSGDSTYNASGNTYQNFGMDGAYHLTTYETATSYLFLNQACCPSTQSTCSGGSYGDNYNDTCLNLKTNALNCGSCGHVCPGNSTCTNGACVCNSGYSSCDSGSYCADLQTDANNCGTCGNVVAPYSCGNGSGCDPLDHGCESSPYKCCGQLVGQNWCLENGGPHPVGCCCNPNDPNWETDCAATCGNQP
jgi:hypothetical protein